MNLRNDGRTSDQVRPIFLKSGVISQAKGSAYLEMDKTKIMCAVYGPRQVRREDFSLQGQLTCEFKFLTFSCKYRRQHQQDNQEKDYSVILLEALEPAVRLEKFPKAKLDIFVTVLEDDGSSLSGAITAASVALADAGIEMYDLVVGAALRQNGKMVLMDPCGPEEYRPERAPAEVNQGSITVGLMPSMHQVAALALRGELDQQTTAKGIKLCIETCQKIYPVVQECLIQSVKKKLAEQKPE
ncbi:exosome complex component MTR3-like [Lingula anatina]|uniref:Exosome complex component MTR3 n=1 Tax=Lingula anatina TaxID=7574 RepID=A0A1S3H7V6_LINAN|nr:exosome complex component MTR3-like [Lingula anatina]|eukprot:XP_013381571.1 exosome complex component MTR3-like [Lingula anatina]